jgi:hypothetical protein
MPETKELVSVDKRPGGSSSPSVENGTNGSQEPKATQQFGDDCRTSAAA